MPTINWRLVIWCVVFFWVWYIGPGWFRSGPLRCNPQVLVTCEPE